MSEIENYNFMRRNSVRQTMARRGSILKPREHYRRGTVVLQHIERNMQKGKKPTDQEVLLYHQLAGIKNTNLVHRRSMVGISVFASGSDGSYDPFVVEKMPLDLQIGFRRKIFGILTLQTLVVNILIYIFTMEHKYVTTFDDYYCPGDPPLFVPSVNATQEEIWWYANETIARNSTDLSSGFHFCAGAFVPGSLTFLAMLGGLFMLYLTKYIFPLNYLFLLAFTLIESLTFVGFKTIFNTNAAVFISGSTFLQVFCMFFLTTLTEDGVDDDTGETVKKPISFYLAAAMTAVIGLITNIILSAAQVLPISFLEFLFSAVFATCITAWFSFDATCMTYKMSPDEYMQAVIFFYTDVILFIIFVMAMCACMMIGDGGGMDSCTCCEGAEFGAVGGGFEGGFEGGGGGGGGFEGGGGYGAWEGGTGAGMVGAEGATPGVGLAGIETGAMGSGMPAQERRNNH